MGVDAAGSCEGLLHLPVVFVVEKGAASQASACCGISCSAWCSYEGPEVFGNSFGVHAAAAVHHDPSMFLSERALGHAMRQLLHRNLT
jgi:hypothetical protein